MTKQKSTKRALLASVLSLVLCVSMLVGSTFAWFTDSATTGVNKIVSGNLDIVLEYRDENGDWKETDANTKLFDDAALWEPGYTEVVYLKVTNKGSLALNYQLAVNVAEEVAGKNVLGESFKLSDYIKFGKVISKDEITAYATREEAQAAATDVTTLQSYNTTEALNSGDETYIALVVYMPTTVGNEANHDGINVPSVKLGVSVFATQTPYEADSYGADYDANAKNEPIVFTSDATYTVVGLTANGSNGVLQATNGATLTINGSGTVNAEEADDGYAMAVWANGGNVVIESGNFEQTITGTETQYDLIYASNGGNITILGGTFQSVTPQWTLNVKDSDRATSHITVMGGRFYKFDPSNAQTGEGEISVPEGFAVVQDGDWYEVVDERVHIENLADLKAFRDDVNAGNNYAGKIVVLDNDIDLANEAWAPIGNLKTASYFAGIFDGQSHTISNLNVPDVHSGTNSDGVAAGSQRSGFFGRIQNATIQNVNIHNAKVTGRQYVSALCATATDNSSFINIKVTGKVTLDGIADMGVVCGAYNVMEGNDTGVMKNITVDVSSDSYVNGNATTGNHFEIGGICGNNTAKTVSDIKSNINVVSAGYRVNAGSYVGGVFGRTQGGNFTNIECSGNVTVTDLSNNYDVTVGKLIGQVRASESAPATATFTNCSATGALSLTIEGTVQTTNGIANMNDLIGSSSTYATIEFKN